MRAGTRIFCLLFIYRNFNRASLILGSMSWISANEQAPIEDLNQFTELSAPNAENGTNAAFASLIR